jgi:hypothetical protein
VVPTGFALPLDTPDSHLVTDGYPFPPSAPPDELEDEELDEGVDGSDGVEAAAGSAAGSSSSTIISCLILFNSSLSITNKYNNIVYYSYSAGGILSG